MDPLQNNLATYNNPISEDGVDDQVTEYAEFRSKEGSEVQEGEVNQAGRSDDTITVKTQFIGAIDTGKTKLIIRLVEDTFTDGFGHLGEEFKDHRVRVGSGSDSKNINTRLYDTPNQDCKVQMLIADLTVHKKTQILGV